MLRKAGKAMILEVKNLSVGFPGKKGRVDVVNDVSFSLKKGEILGIVGESGSGKSVTANSIIRLLPKSAIISKGKIILDGKNLLNVSEKQMCRLRGNEVAMIYQEPMTALNPVFTIGKQIEESIRIHERINKLKLKKRVIELLELVKIPEPDQVYKKYPHELSGGMRQRVVIAMAIACNPKIIIADEPTTALDVTIQIEILQLLKEIAEKLETSIILITHDLGVVAEIADRVLVMYCGKILEEAEVNEFFDNAVHPYSKGLILSRPSNVQGNRLYSIPKMVPNIEDIPPNSCVFQSRCEKAVRECEEICPSMKSINENHKVRCILGI